MGQVVEMINRAKDALLLIIGAVSLLMLVVGGVRWVTAGSDGGQKMGAKDTVKNSLIGLAVALGAPLLISIVKTIIGV
jgi:hypothetical protein